MTSILLAGLAAVALSDSLGDWTRVEHLLPAATIELTLDGSAASIRRFAGADDRTITVLARQFATLPKGFRKMVREMLVRIPDAAAVIAGGVEMQKGDLVISRDGVFEAGHRIAALADVLETIPSARVLKLQVALHAKRKGIALGALLGISHGMLAGQGLQCRDCPGQAIATAVSAVAIDSVIGALLTRHAPRFGLVYLRPMTMP